MGQAGTALFTIGGNLLGAYIGGPVGASIGGLAGGLVGSLIFNRAKKPVIPDLNLMNSSYGNPIPLLWGTALLPGVVIWITPVQVVDNGGGKGGPSAKASAPSVYTSAGIAFLEIGKQRRAAKLARLYLNGKLFLDMLAGNPLGQAVELATHQFAIRAYDGNEAQLPDYLYVLWCSQFITPPQAVPANRGLAYLVFDHINIEQYGQVFPQTTAIWTTNTDVTVTLAAMTGQMPTSVVATPNFFNNVQVDWTRGFVYALDGNRILVQIAIATGQIVAERDLSSIMVPASIAVGQGTSVYVFGANHDPQPSACVVTLNPIGLSGGDPLPLTVPAANIGDPPVSLLYYDVPYTNVVVSLRSGSTTSELIVGSLSPNSAVASVVDPGTGAVLTGPLHYQDFFAGNAICLGARASDGSGQDVWFLQWDTFDTSQSLYLFKARIELGTLSLFGGTSASAITPQLMAVFTPQTFGLGAGNGIGGLIAYDKSRDGVIISPKGWPAGVGCFEWTQAGSILWTSAATALAGNIISDSGTVGGVDFAGNAVVIDTSNGQTSGSSFPPGTGVAGPVQPGMAFFNSSGNALLWINSNTFYVARLSQVNATEVPVANIITDICDYAGLTPADIDVSLIENTTTGYVIRDHKSVGAALADLCHVYSIDIVESDFKLKFIPRGQPPVVTITQADLASLDPNDSSKYWQPTRAQELEMPLTLNVKYMDPALEYQPGAAYASRIALPWPTTYSKRRLQMDLPLVLSNAEARSRAEILLYTMWNERVTYRTALGPKHLFLDPGDNVEVVLDNGSSYGVRMQVQELSPDLMMHPTFCSEDVASYVPAGTPGAVPGPPPQVIQQQPFGTLLQFNVPLLQDSDAVTGGSTRIYAAAGSTAAPWQGGGLFVSPDSVTWTLQTTVGPAAVYGFSKTALPDYPPAFSLDRKSRVTINLAFGETPPESITYDELMAGGNAALLGSELIQFQNVTVNSDGSITLDTFTRGNRGTEWAIADHTTNEPFIMLVAGKLIGSRMSTSLIGVRQFWELLPNGGFIDQVPAQPFTYLGYDLFPYAPVNFSRQNSGSDLQFNWERRTRIGGELIDGTDTVPLNEDSEVYEAYLLPNAAARAAFDPLTPATYTRAWVGLGSPQVLYTAAEMTTDSFNRATDAAPLVVYQVSASVGRGFPGYELIPAF